MKSIHILKSFLLNLIMLDATIPCTHLKRCIKFVEDMILSFFNTKNNKFQLFDRYTVLINLQDQVSLWTIWGNDAEVLVWVKFWHKNCSFCAYFSINFVYWTLQNTPKLAIFLIISEVLVIPWRHQLKL